MARTRGFRPVPAIVVRVAPLLALLLALGAIASPSRAAPSAARQATPDASPVAGDTIGFVGLLAPTGPLSVADLQALPTETVEVTSETRDGAERLSFTGTRLYPLLEPLHPIVGADARNPWPIRDVTVTAKDGDRVLPSGGELAADFGAAPILLAGERDGQPLAGEDGPVCLVTPGDIRGGRYVSGAVPVEVRALDDPAG